LDDPSSKWQDAVLMAPRERLDIACVADDPGDRIFHHPIVGHEAAGRWAWSGYEHRSDRWRDTMRLLSVVLLIASLTLSVPAVAGESSRQATLYKNPQCGCCEGYADYLRDNGFEVTVQPTHDLPLLHRQYGVPEPLVGCHTTLIDGYVVEGHVPIGALLRMLTERPAIKGISLPGMPAGSPGMSGEKTQPFTIYEIGDGEPKVYAVE
jgi:hypothetical protein